MNISPNLESIFVHKLLDTIESYLLLKILTSDNLFLKAVLDLSFKPSSFIPAFIPTPEGMVVPPIFTTDVLVGPSTRTLGFSRSYSNKAMFLIWRCISRSPNEIYLCLHCLKDICGLVQHCVHHILHNLWPMYEPH